MKIHWRPQNVRSCLLACDLQILKPKDTWMPKVLPFVLYIQKKQGQRYYMTIPEVANAKHNVLCFKIICYQLIIKFRAPLS